MHRRHELFGIATGSTQTEHDPAGDTAMEAAGGNVPIASGQQEVVVTVTAVWSLL